MVNPIAVSRFNLSNHPVDSRGYLELRYAHATANGWNPNGRAYYDAYHFQQLASYDIETGRVLNYDTARALDTVRMAENAMGMIHNPTGGVLGEAKDMRETADLLDKLRLGILAAYCAKTAAV